MTTSTPPTPAPTPSPSPSKCVLSIKGLNKDCYEWVTLPCFEECMASVKLKWLIGGRGYFG